MNSEFLQIKKLYFVLAEIRRAKVGNDGFPVCTVVTTGREPQKDVLSRMSAVKL